MIQDRDNAIEGASAATIRKHAAANPPEPEPIEQLRARRMIRQACVRNADRIQEWMAQDDPILSTLRGLRDPRSGLTKSPEKIEHRWLQRAHTLGSCARFWARLRCGCGHGRTVRLVCNDRFCRRCAKKRRKALEARVAAMIRSFDPEEFDVFRVELTRRNPDRLLGSSRSLNAALKRFRKDPYIKRTIAGGGRKFEVSHGESVGPHPHLHLVVFVRRPRGRRRARLEWAEVVSAWQHANGCACPRHGPDGKPGLCIHDSTNDNRKGLFHVPRPEETECTGAHDVGASGQRVNWKLNLRAKGDRVRIVKEIAKYIGKEIADPRAYGFTVEDLADLLLETQGLRAWQTFGEAYGKDKLPEKARQPRICPSCKQPWDPIVVDILPGDPRSPRPPPTWYEIRLTG